MKKHEPKLTWNQQRRQKYSKMAANHTPGKKEEKRARNPRPGREYVSEPLVVLSSRENNYFETDRFCGDYRGVGFGRCVQVRAKFGADTLIRALQYDFFKVFGTSVEDVRYSDSGFDGSLENLDVIPSKYQGHNAECAALEVAEIKTLISKVKNSKGIV